MCNLINSSSFSLILSVSVLHRINDADAGESLTRYVDGQESHQSNRSRITAEICSVNKSG